MQDYNYGYAGCMEMTLEISCCKYPSSDQLTEYWLDNKNSLLEYLYQVNMGMSSSVYVTSGLSQAMPLVFSRMFTASLICLL